VWGVLRYGVSGKVSRSISTQVLDIGTIKGNVATGGNMLDEVAIDILQQMKVS